MHDRVMSELEDILREVFVRRDLTVTAETSAQDIEGWDSFRQIEIVMAAEAWFGVRFGTRELEGLRCVGDLARVITERLATAG